jgi:succinate-acetate transporter protein
LGVLVFADSTGHSITPILTGSSFTWFWFVWSVVMPYIWIVSLRTNFALSTFVGLMAAMFWCLWLGELTLGRPGTGWTQAAGFVGWAAAVVGGYTSFAEMINATIGRVILPEFATDTFQSMAAGRS